MKTFKSYIKEDLSKKYLGLCLETLRKMANDNRKYSPAQRKEIEDVLKLRQQNEEAGHAPSNNTGSVPGAGDDNTLHMRKMRTFKAIHRRHRIPEIKKEFIK